MRMKKWGRTADSKKKVAVALLAALVMVLLAPKVAAVAEEIGKNGGAQGSNRKVTLKVGEEELKNNGEYIYCKEVTFYVDFGEADGEASGDATGDAAKGVSDTTEDATGNPSKRNSIKIGDEEIVLGIDNSYTISEKGKYQITAENKAGYQINVTITINEDHTWDDGEVTEPATEDKEGKKVYTCKVCKKTKEETIPKVDITAPEIKGIEDNGVYCESAAFEVIETNLKCVKVDGKEIVLEDGSYTIDTAGVYTVSAEDNSGHETQLTITIYENHIWDVYYIWKADGSQARVKFICQHSRAHREYHDLIITSKEKIPATCVKKGVTAYTGTVTIDGKVYKDSRCIEDIEVDPTNHDGGTSIKDKKKAGCKAAGYTGDIYCKGCGKLKTVGKKIKALGYSWNTGKITKKPTNTKEGVLKFTCKNGCGHTKTTVLPKKVVTVELGKTAKVISKVSDCKINLPNASRYKKYLTLNVKTGQVTTKKYYKVEINKSIPVNVVVNGKTYKVAVKIKIPAPKITVTKKKVTVGGIQGYRYTFKYNVKGADRIKVRMEKGGSSGINRELDRDISKPKSNKLSYIQYSERTMKKLKNKVTFKIVAYYGKNVSEPLFITK